MRGLDNEEGKTFFLYLSLKEGQAQEISAKTLRTLGWKCNDITKLEGLGSCRVDVVEYEEEYKGKVRSKFDVWPTRGPRPTLRDEDVANFAARFKALAVSAPVIEIGEHNAAPAVIPAARPTNGKGGTTRVTDGGEADASSLYK
jgi:hypothetical protein